VRAAADGSVPAVQDARLPAASAGATVRQQRISDRLETLAELRQGWDSYNGNPVSDAAHEAVWYLLSLDVPFIAPTPDGGLCIDWSHGGAEISLECGPDGRWRSFSFEVTR
jgi:hypothetical protein